jgi:hypothetical protein
MTTIIIWPHQWHLIRVNIFILRISDGQTIPIRTRWYRKNNNETVVSRNGRASHTLYTKPFETRVRRRLWNGTRKSLLSVALARRRRRHIHHRGKNNISRSLLVIICDSPTPSFLSRPFFYHPSLLPLCPSLSFISWRATLNNNNKILYFTRRTRGSPQHHHLRTTYTHEGALYVYNIIISLHDRSCLLFHGLHTYTHTNVATAE